MSAPGESKTTLVATRAAFSSGPALLGALRSTRFEDVTFSGRNMSA